MIPRELFSENKDEKKNNILFTHPENKKVYKLEGKLFNPLEGKVVIPNNKCEIQDFNPDNYFRAGLYTSSYPQKTYLRPSQRNTA